MSTAIVVVSYDDFDVTKISLGPITKCLGECMSIAPILYDGKILHLKTPKLYCPDGGLGDQDHKDIRLKLFLDDDKGHSFHEFEAKLDSFDRLMTNGRLGSIDSKYTYCPTKQIRSIKGTCTMDPFICVHIPSSTKTQFQPLSRIIDENGKLLELAPTSWKDHPLIPTDCWCQPTIMGRFWSHSSKSFGVKWFIDEMTVSSRGETFTKGTYIDDGKVGDDDDDDDDDDDSDDNHLPHLISKDLEVYSNLYSNLSPFGTTFDGPDYLFMAPLKYARGEKTTVSLFDLISRLIHELNGCFDGFSWDHACISGGLLTGLIDSKYDPKIYSQSDIDLFIYGATPEETKKYFYKAFKFFQHMLPDLRVSPRASDKIMVIDLVTKQINRPIQLIGVCGASNPLEVIKHFDLSHCQIAYDGKQFSWTQEFAKTMQTHQSIITGNWTSASRLLRAYQRGFSVMMPDHPVHVNSYQKVDNYEYMFHLMTHIIDNVKEYTLEKIMKCCEPTTSHPHPDQHLVLSTPQMNVWLRKYMETHTPNDFK